jgi:hypothetical protein
MVLATHNANMDVFLIGVPLIGLLVATYTVISTPRKR